ncbi:cytochrome c [Lysobacter sp. CFH 32150]|uniref:c-type cytochrome n=1 Tax=Lysobacter sp. CFH 32150 TaxID=2927128 RepID=UPI001FA6DBB2|nr:cytochrome c [Lysobacter sp. CFH 32150]MCI4567528.1 cytochrome c [Lysobacter sp. CFH 32150]
MDGKRGVVARAWAWFCGIRLGQLLKVALGVGLLAALAAVAGFYVFVLYPVRSIPPAETFDEIIYLGQGWGDGADATDRQTYYYTPQGASLPQGAELTPLRYAWFVNLEMPLDQSRFAAPEHMQRYRFLVDPAPTAANPDRLPVGFARHFDAAIGEQVLDVTCAACHTGQLIAERQGRRVAVRIDGGQAMHAFTDMQRGSFGPTLLASLVATYFNPMKFDRFARKVIGPRYPDGKSELRAAMWQTIEAFATQGQNSPLRHLYPVREGFGRTDALGRIANTVFGDHLVPGNYQHADAPVSYPYLWNIWKFDWVQYNGSVKQPLARNVGEAMGVGATLRLTDTYGNPLPEAERFRSSVLIPNLVTIEHTLQKLQPPQWPEALLGAIDRPLAERGRDLFQSHCQGCHGPHPANAALQRAEAPLKSSPGTVWHIEVVPLAHVGTDPAAAAAFVEHRYDLGRAGLTQTEVASLLRPLLVRDLARDARYRLSAVIDARSAAHLPTATLAAQLDAYPHPDADPQPTLPIATFTAIRDVLQREGVAVPTGDKAPGSPYDCALDCHTAWLMWDVTRAQAGIERHLASIDVSRLSEGEGLNVLGLMVKQKFFDDHRIDYATRQCIEGFGTLDLPQQIAGYKPRPLEGVWATPPFLHNGSVPNLYQMLLPPEQRSARFYVGRRDFDAKHVGYVAEPLPGDDAGFWLDTSIAGNHNTGHAFVASTEQLQRNRENPSAHPLPPGVIGPLLGDAERWAIIEYLKIHRDLPATPSEFSPPRCGNWQAQP